MRTSASMELWWVWHRKDVDESSSKIYTKQIQFAKAKVLKNTQVFLISFSKRLWLTVRLRFWGAMLKILNPYLFNFQFIPNLLLSNSGFVIIFFYEWTIVFFFTSFHFTVFYSTLLCFALHYLILSYFILFHLILLYFTLLYFTIL